MCKSASAWQPAMFDAPRHLTFTPDELAIFRRPIAGAGGYQGLLDELVSRLHGPDLDVTEAELAKAYKLAYDYQSGGYQQRFRVLCAAARRTGWQA